MTKVHAYFLKIEMGIFLNYKLYLWYFFILEVEKKIFQIKGKEIILCKGHKGNVSDR